MRIRNKKEEQLDTTLVSESVEVVDDAAQEVELSPAAVEQHLKINEVVDATVNLADTITTVTEDNVETTPDSTSETADVTQGVEVLTGTFKVYRGRNISTITAMTNTVVRDGDEIIENGIKWLPVVFNSKAGTLSRGFIITK